MKIREATAADLPKSRSKKAPDQELVDLFRTKGLHYLFVAEIDPGETRRTTVAAVKLAAATAGFGIKTIKGKGDPVIELVAPEPKKERKPRTPKEPTPPSKK